MAAKKTTKKASKKELADTNDETGGTSKSRSIELAIKEIKTKFGDEAIMTYGNSKPAAIASIPTGSIGLDAALGIGGLPCGRIIEVFGPE
jgi:recombination protein RecA